MKYPAKNANAGSPHNDHANNPTDATSPCGLNMYNPHDANHATNVAAVYTRTGSR
ncbi:MAG TPA: hypothetical protein VNV66_16055 [Pilimelia sp.]|nr:hypothetical protein [Pilimelia sp.]